MHILRPAMFLAVAKKVASSLKNYINPTLRIICSIIQAESIVSRERCQGVMNMQNEHQDSHGMNWQVEY